MKAFMDKDFLLDTDTAKKKVHNAAVRIRHAYESAEENKKKEEN